MDWGFVWIMVILKIPLFAILGVLWWAVKSAPDPMADEEPVDDGPGPHRPLPPTPLAPRRGPHGEPAVPSPPRARPVTARARVKSD